MSLLQYPWSVKQPYNGEAYLAGFKREHYDYLNKRSHTGFTFNWTIRHIQFVLWRHSPAILPHNLPVCNSRVVRANWSGERLYVSFSLDYLIPSSGLHSVLDLPIPYFVRTK